MTYTDEQVTKAIENAVALKGADYVYPESEKSKGGCMYATADGGPSCIVGHVLHEIDLGAFREVAKWERAKGTGDTAVDDATERLGLPFSDEQVTALREAQIRQDRGVAWGAAAGAYEIEMGRMQ